MYRCCRAKVRRREHAAAVVCALSLFVALVAGSALRPHYTTNALPEPGAWTHAVAHVQHDFTEVQPVSATGSLIALKARDSSRPMPIARKPFRYVWMTHDLPSDWAPLSPPIGLVGVTEILCLGPISAARRPLCCVRGGF